MYLIRNIERISIAANFFTFSLKLKHELLQARTSFALFLRGQYRIFQDLYPPFITAVNTACSVINGRLDNGRNSL